MLYQNTLLLQLKQVHSWLVPFIHITSNSCEEELFVIKEHSLPSDEEFLLSIDLHSGIMRVRDIIMF